MTWFRVDDTLAAHAKVRRAGVPAMGMWVIAGAYCSQQLTDGFVPDWFVQGFPGGKKYASSLVQAGLWSEASNGAEQGWQFHDWEQANPTRAQVQADRKKAKDRQQAWRDRHRDDAVRNGVTDAVSNGVSNAAPTRPDPTLKKDASADAAADPPRTDVEGLCRYFVKAVGRNGVQAKITSKWHTDARLMLDRDKREPNEIRAVIDWASQDSFWRANILSVPKLREKYDQLRLQMLAGRPALSDDYDPHKEHLRGMS